MPPQAITIIYNKYWLKLLVTACYICRLKTTFLKVLNEKISIFRIFVFYFCVLVCWYAKRNWMTFTGSLIQWDATFCRPFYINHSTSGNILCKLILSPPLSHRQISLNHTSWGQGSLGLYNSCLIYLLCTVTQRCNNNESTTYSIIVYMQDKSG